MNRHLIIDYILIAKQDSDLYTNESLEALPDENLLAISDRIFVERKVEKSKPCEMCNMQDCDRC